MLQLGLIFQPMRYTIQIDQAPGLIDALPIIRLTWLTRCWLLGFFHPSLNGFRGESSRLVFGKGQAKPSAWGSEINFH